MYFKWDLYYRLLKKVIYVAKLSSMADVFSEIFHLSILL